VKDEYFALGGGSVIIDKEERPSELSIVHGHSNLSRHYSLWEHMFTDILRNIPREELEKKIDGINIGNYPLTSRKKYAIVISEVSVR
jgi:hypothetical protein